MLKFEQELTWEDSVAEFRSCRTPDGGAAGVWGWGGRGAGAARGQQGATRHRVGAARGRRHRRWFQVRRVSRHDRWRRRRRRGAAASDRRVRRRGGDLGRVRRQRAARRFDRRRLWLGGARTRLLGVVRVLLLVLLLLLPALGPSVLEPNLKHDTVQNVLIFLVHFNPFITKMQALLNNSIIRHSFKCKIELIQNTTVNRINITNVWLEVYSFIVFKRTIDIGVSSRNDTVRSVQYFHIPVEPELSAAW